MPASSANFTPSRDRDERLGRRCVHRDIHRPTRRRASVDPAAPPFPFPSLGPCVALGIGFVLTALAAGCKQTTTTDPTTTDLRAPPIPSSPRSNVASSSSSSAGPPEPAFPAGPLGSGSARFLLAAGDAALEQGRVEEARRHYEKAASVARKTSDSAEEILALNQLGVLAERRGALEDAQDHYERALELQQVTGRGPGETLLRTNLAAVLRRRGEFEAAEREARQAIELTPPGNDPAGAATAHRLLGLILADQERLDEACSALALSAELYARAGRPTDEAATRLELGRTLLDHGDARHAIPQLSRAGEGLEKARGRDGLALPSPDRIVVLHLLADAYERLEEPKTALTFRERAIELARRTGDVEVLGRLLEQGIATATAVGRGDLAEQWRRERAGLDRGAGR